MFAFVPASDHSLLIVVDTSSSAGGVAGLFRALRSAHAPFVLDLHPAYASVLVEFDLARADHARVERLVRRLEIVDFDVDGKTVELPVTYDGPDLDDVAAHTGLTRDEVIERHSSALYRVAFLGFLPGFAYLEGLPSSLATPRLATPRASVPRGSLAIGGAQTAVYPQASPGGWRIIGHTDVDLPPGWVEPGDLVRFVAVA